VFDFAGQEDFSAYLDELLAVPLTQAKDLRSVQSEIESIYSLVTCNTDNNTYRIVLSCTPVRSMEQTEPPAIQGQAASTSMAQETAGEAASQ
jgi:hypothetical protein